MWKLISVIAFLSIFHLNSANGNYAGPFILWGVPKLQNLQLPILKPIDEKTLTTLYTEAKAVVLFLRNNTNKLDKENFPSLTDILEKNGWAYMPQISLPADPIDYNSNFEIINLVGPSSQQDIELSALYKDTVTIYGEGEVLGILANQADDVHFIYKREVNNDELTTTSNPIDETLQENFIYLSKKAKALLYTTAAPVLFVETDEKANNTKELRKHDSDVNADDRDNLARLIVRFSTDTGEKITVRFRFPIKDGYWSLNAVEIEIKDSSLTALILPIVGTPPSAPVGFSYNCPRPVVFRNGTNTLTLRDIQVQPLLGGQRFFSDAYDCIGFTTAPIWSGIFVSSIIVFGTFVGILALMDIKAPNRFESSRNKQLTFTVQE